MSSYNYAAISYICLYHYVSRYKFWWVRFGPWDTQELHNKQESELLGRRRQLESLMLPENGQDFENWMKKWQEEKCLPTPSRKAQDRQFSVQFSSDQQTPKNMQKICILAFAFSSTSRIQLKYGFSSRKCIFFAYFLHILCISDFQKPW